MSSVFWWVSGAKTARVVKVRRRGEKSANMFREDEEREGAARGRFVLGKRQRFGCRQSRPDRGFHHKENAASTSAVCITGTWCKVEGRYAVFLATHLRVLHWQLERDRVSFPHCRCMCPGVERFCTRSCRRSPNYCRDAQRGSACGSNRPYLCVWPSFQVDCWCFFHSLATSSSELSSLP
jgi:hypothetical protein